ncbi:hypothetical protein [Methanogenium cariaci]|uniref:hypothetical protein n=1 Tax=Methanogenium cariaci TaxID=2197 RepID=UPI0007820FE0|nr:hypothetical protein [Methanogenium cariaci]
MIRAEEEKLEAAQNDYQKTVQEIAGLEGEVRVLRDSIKRQGEELKEAERLFDEAVCSAGFLGEGDFAVALLAPEEAADLRKERDRLKQWQAGIAAQRASALKEAETHRSLAGTVKDEAALTKELHALSTVVQESNTRRAKYGSSSNARKKKSPGMPNSWNGLPPSGPRQTAGTNSMPSSGRQTERSSATSRRVSPSR